MQPKQKRDVPHTSNNDYRTDKKPHNKMNIKPLIICLSAALLQSCIKEEAPNAEADILRVTLPQEIIQEGETDYYRPYDNSIQAYPLSIEVAFGTDLTSIAPTFELTPGATMSVVERNGDTVSIDMVNPRAMDFSIPVRYIVTSESRQWQRCYQLDIHYPDTREIPTVYHFETAHIQENYYILSEQDTEHAPLIWASGNAGYAIAAQLQGITSPDDFPTTICNDGYDGNCLKLTTLLTGDWGAKVGKPIAAGNLFMGTFYLPTALTNSLNSTRFGIPFRHKPIAMNGYYRYTAGERFYDGGIYTDEQDKFSIYAMFFEKGDKGEPYLDGNIPSSGFSHPRLAATALMDDSEKIECDEWRRFEIPFDYERFGKQIDPHKLANGGYYIAVVFASSSGGDEFKGAPGSTLYVDEVEIIYE